MSDTNSEEPPIIFGEPIPQPTTITIEELMSSAEALTKKESDDRLLITNLFNQTIYEIKPKLLTWASLGFPYNYVFFSIQVTPPSQCSDGVSRNVYFYIEFLTGKTVSENLREFEQKIPGMVLSYSDHINRMDIHISKA